MPKFHLVKTVKSDVSILRKSSFKYFRLILRNSLSKNIFSESGHYRHLGISDLAYLQKFFLDIGCTRYIEGFVTNTS